MSLQLRQSISDCKLECWCITGYSLRETHLVFYSSSPGSFSGSMRFYHHLFSGCIREVQIIVWSKPLANCDIYNTLPHRRGDIYATQITAAFKSYLGMKRCWFKRRIFIICWQRYLTKIFQHIAGFQCVNKCDFNLTSV